MHPRNRLAFFTISFLLLTLVLSSCSAPSSSPTVSPTPPPAPTQTTRPTQLPTTATLKPVLASELTSYTPGENVITRDYRWIYKGTTYLWRIEVPESLYLYFKGKQRTVQRNWSAYIAHSADDAYIKALANELSEVARQRGFSHSEKIQFAASFIQSLPYTSDNVTTGYDEYPRYPLETLVDNGGDCEDTSILACAVISSMKYATALVSPPGHMMTAILGNYANNVTLGFSGRYYDVGEHNDVLFHFYYLETTGEGWNVGEVPPGVEVEKINRIYPIAPVPIVDIRFNASRVGTSGTITVTATNVGSATLEQGYVLVEFDTGNDMRAGYVQSAPFDLPSDATNTVTLTYTLPEGRYMRLRINVFRVSSNAIWWDTVYSNWFDT